VGVRFLALILDLIPLIVLGVVLVGPVLGDFLTVIVEAMPARPSVGRNAYPELQAAMAEAMTTAAPGFFRAGALFQVGGLLYFAGSWLAFSRSPAMALLGLRIVREEDGGRLDLARVAVRYGGYLLSAVPFLFGFAWALIDGRKQAWHDKLAGTVVVRRDASRAVAAPYPDAEPAPPDAPARRRPSIGAVAEAAWQTYRRSPLDLLASLAVVLVPTMIVLLPLIALYLIAQQDQLVLTFQFMRDTFNQFSGDPADYAQFVENNRRVLASAAPSVLITALAGFVGSITASLLIGAGAAAVDDTPSSRPAAAVTKDVVARLPALLTLGVAAGLVLALEVLLLGLPSLSAASATASTFDSERFGLEAAADGAALGAVLGAIVITPLSIYLGPVWLLAVACVVPERVGAMAAARRAWQLSRGRMRWLIGIMVATSLAVYAILGPTGLLPVGLLAEDYIAGDRLPTAISVVTVGLVSLLATPLFCLICVEAYRAARNDASGGPAA
jgi:uncharacterized RDD family membrane protein YckC